MGIPEAVYGEKVIAFVTLKPGAHISEDAVIDFMKSKTAKFKLPSKIHFVGSIPKTLVGKVLKRELREKAVKMERTA